MSTTAYWKKMNIEWLENKSLEILKVLLYNIKLVQ